MINFYLGLLRFLIAVLTTSLSYYTSNGRLIYWLWLALTLVLTFLSYQSDVKQNWGFFETKDWLRTKLAYPHKSYYYCAIVFNMLLRLSWAMTLSSFASSTPLIKNSVKSLVAMLELFRRFIWNCFRVEYEHLKNEGNFNSVRDYKFPFVVKIDLSKAEDRQKVEKHFRGFLKQQHVNEGRALYDIQTANMQLQAPNFSLGAKGQKMQSLSTSQQIEYVSESQIRKDLEIYSFPVVETEELLKSLEGKDFTRYYGLVQITPTAIA